MSPPGRDLFGRDWHFCLTLYPACCRSGHASRVLDHARFASSPPITTHRTSSGICSTRLDSVSGGTEPCSLLFLLIWGHCAIFKLINRGSDFGCLGAWTRHDRRFDSFVLCGCLCFCVCGVGLVPRVVSPLARTSSS
jgi:hypothetical protein